MSRKDLQIPGLDPNATYAVQIRGLDADGNPGAWSTQFQFITYQDDMPPAKPENLSINVEGSNFLIRWDAVTKNEDGTDLDDLRDYVVSITANGQTETWTTVDNKFDLTYSRNANTFDGARPSIDVSVVARDRVGNNSIAATGSATKPPPVAPMLAAAAKRNAVELTWSNEGDDLSHFEVRKNDAAYAQIGGNTFIWTDTDVGEGAQQYVVRAVDRFGQATDSNLVVEGEVSLDIDQDTVAPKPPTNPGGTTEEAGPNLASAVLSWDAPTQDVDDTSYTDQEGFEVRYRTDPSRPWNYRRIPDLRVDGSTPERLEIELGGLTAGATLSWQVRAFDRSYNYSAWLSDTLVLAADTTPPDTPTGLSVDGGIRTVSATWARNSEPDLAGYRVYASQTSGFTPDAANLVFEGLGNTTSFAAGDNETWHVVVSAFDHAGNESAVSLEDSASTLNLNDTTPPDDVTGLSLGSFSYQHGGVEFGTLEVYWTNVTDADGYIIAWRDIGLGTEWTEEWSGGAESAFHRISGLRPGRDHEVKMKAVRNSTRSVNWTAIASHTIQSQESQTMNVPTGFAALAGMGTVDFSWDSNAESATAFNDYHLQLATDAGFTANVRNVYPKNNSYQYSAPTGTTVYGRVRARSIYGNLSGWSSVDSAAPIGINTDDINEIDLGAAGFIGRLRADQIIVGGSTQYDSGYDPTTKISYDDEIGGGNLAPNSSFEDDLTGWSPAGVPTVAVADVARTGGRSVRMTGPSTGRSRYLVSGYIPVPEGVPVTGSAYSRDSSGASLQRVMIQFFDESRASIGPQHYGDYLSSSDTGWTRHKNTATSPANTRFVRIFLMSGSISDGDFVWWDDVQVEVGDIATAYAPNADEIASSYTYPTSISAGRSLAEHSTFYSWAGNFANRGRIELDLARLLELFDGEQEATLEMWVNLNSLGNYGLVELTGQTTTNGNLYPYASTTGHPLYLNVFRNNRVGPIYHQYHDNPAGGFLRWHHLAITTRPGVEGWNVYLDGEHIHTASGETQNGSVPLDNGNTVSAAIGWSSSDRQMDGAVQDVRLWKKARTRKQIVESMTARLSGYEDGLVGYWVMDEGSGEPVDKTGNFTGFQTVVGGGRWDGRVERAYQDAENYSNLIEEAIRGDFTGTTTGTLIDGARIQTGTVDADLLVSDIAIINGLRVQSLFEINTAGVIRSENFDATAKTGFRITNTDAQLYSGSIILGGSGLNINTETDQMWFGADTFANAAWRVDSTGRMRVGTNFHVLASGELRIGADSTTAPVRITNAGLAEFRNVRILGTSLPNGALLLNAADQFTIGKTAGGAWETRLATNMFIDAGGNLQLNGGNITLTSGNMTMNGGTFSMAGGAVNFAGAAVNVNSGGSFTVNSGDIVVSGGTGRIRSGNYNYSNKTGWALENGNLYLFEGEINASLINIQQGSNLVDHGYSMFSYAPEWYQTNITPSSATGFVISQTSVWSRYGKTALRLQNTSGAARYAYLSDTTSNYNIAVEEDGQYIMSAYVHNSGASSTSIRLAWRRSTGTNHVFGPTETLAPGETRRIWAIASSVAGQTGAMAALYMADDGDVTVDGLQLEPQLGDNTEPSFFKAGGVTTISGGQITTGAIQSSNWTGTGGTQGWRIGLNGDAVFKSGEFRGDVYADNGYFKGDITGASGTFSGALSAATGSFAGDISAASGTFSGSLSAVDGSMSTITISNYMTSSTYTTSSGWRVFSSGLARFYNIDARGGNIAGDLNITSGGSLTASAGSGTSETKVILSTSGLSFHKHWSSVGERREFGFMGIVGGDLRIDATRGPAGALQLWGDLVQIEGDFINIGSSNFSVTTSKLTMNGSGEVITVGASGASYIGIRRDGTRHGYVGLGSSSNTNMILYANGTLQLEVGSGEIVSNHLGSRTTSSSANFFISSGGTMARSTSSGRFKKDVETMQAEYADHVIDNVRPVWFRSNAPYDLDHVPASWSYWGFIAEEVYVVDPRLVHLDEDTGTPEGVQYDRMVPHIVNRLQRDKAANAERDERIEELEAKLEALEARLAAAGI